MSDLKELIGVGDSTTFPGYVLSPPRLIEFAEAEEEATAWYLRRIAKSAAGLPEAVRQSLHERAVDNLKSSPFSFGTSGFDRWALSMSAASFLTWLLLRIKRPEMTLAQAAALLNEAPNPLAKMNAVWEMWGYRAAKKPAAPPAAPQTGGASSTGSADAEARVSATKTPAD
jgi:hypothetical protein